MAFAICDQGSAAAFSGLRIARAYASSAGVRRALLIVVEQAALPYGCPVPLPSQHRGVAMLYAPDASSGSDVDAGSDVDSDGDGAAPWARVAGVRQHRASRPAMSPAWPPPTSPSWRPDTTNRGWSSVTRLAALWTSPDRRAGAGDAARAAVHRRVVRAHR